MITAASSVVLRTGRQLILLLTDGRAAGPSLTYSHCGLCRNHDRETSTETGRSPRKSCHEKHINKSQIRQNPSLTGDNVREDHNQRL